MNASNLSQPSRLFRSLTKRGLILVVALAVLAQLVVLAWYRGLIPCFEGQERACLRDALNLWVLPSGLTITASGIDDSSIRRYAFDAEVESNAIEVHVSRLRKKLGAEIIVTERGLGYRLGHA